MWVPRDPGHSHEEVGALTLCVWVLGGGGGDGGVLWYWAGWWLIGLRSSVGTVRPRPQPEK